MSTQVVQKSGEVYLENPKQFLEMPFEITIKVPKFEF